MRRCSSLHSSALSCYVKHLRRLISVKLFFLICCFVFALSLIFIQFNEDTYLVNENLVIEAIKDAANDSRYAEVYRKPSRLPKDLKYILIWMGGDFAPLYYFGKGQRNFIERNCSMINCYVTTNRRFFRGDLTKFNAIAFNGRSIHSKLRRYHLPSRRSPHQKYIFFDMESSDNYPVCNDFFDGYFNWTSTYKLDSDIPYPYLHIRNSLGEIVGPRKDMEWVKDMNNVSKELLNKITGKTKPLAWFVSHCATRSKRQKYMKLLQKSLTSYNFTVDIYGSCGTLNCSRVNQSDCDSKLENDYYFYYSAENSFAEDYVTEKLLSALQHNVVPIVYGGADYSRFLPPGSYLDARRHKPSQLAAKIVHLMNSPKEYVQFFTWKSHYSYHDPKEKENLCSVCEALNNEKLMKTSTVYYEFRKWWNPNFMKRCKL